MATRTRTRRTWPRWLPQGGSLPEPAWQARHRAVCALLWVHVFVVPVYAVVRDNTLTHGLVETIPVLLGLGLAKYPLLSRNARAAAAALGLMVCSGLFVHLSDGLIEAHFHFFVMIPIIALYEAWLPFALGVGYVLVHHGVMGTLDPHSVYNHQLAWDHPWLFAGVHGFFFASACVACVVNWWLHENARESERELASTLAYRATHDPLTGLPNRTAFLGQDAPAGTASVLLLNLDGFKEVVDTLGHALGDHLLTQVADRLRAALPPGNLLAYVGGDEFAVLLPGTDEAAAHDVASHLLGALAPDFLVDDLQLGINASVGLVSHVGDGADLESMLRRADVAMIRAKRTHAGVAGYDPTSDEHTRERLALLTELRRALDCHELVLHYQPKLSLADDSLTGVEALVRWQHPDRGLLAPGEFIPAAEHTVLIIRLTSRVIDLALTQTACWLDRGHAVPVAVNVSPRCVLEPDFAADVLAALQRAHVPAHLLRLEITESTLVEDPARAGAVLAELSAMGVGLSIDDFGTGYSSMSHLRHLPIDELKIDRSFVAGMLDHREDAILVQSAIDLGHNLGLSVVAEGVETPEVLAALASGGCDTAQGFLLSRPMPPAALDPWLTPDRAAAPHPA